MMNLVAVFADTEKIYNNSEYLKNAVENTIKNQYIVSDNSQIKPFDKTPKYAQPAKVFVSMKRSFQAAENYKNEKVCVLNFASARHAGGGVKTGARAQEECLCRCSTLYFAISEKNTVKNFHQKHNSMIINGQMDLTYNDDCIFSPDIVVFKADEGAYKYLPEDKQYQVDVITCAAPNLNKLCNFGGITESELREIHESRARRILDIAKSENEEVLVLGAFGCGAFRNPPEIVADVWAKVLQDYLYDFKTVEFAIVSNPSKPSDNFIAFQRTFKKYFK